MIKLSFIKPN